MIIVKTPGINGLSKTEGCRNAVNEISKRLSSKNIKEISLNNQNLPEQEQEIYETSLKLLKSEKDIAFIGGDHSISYPIGKAFLQHTHKNSKEPFLIVFDAHADCMPPMQEPTHEEWLRALIENGFPSQNIILIGATDLEKEESQYLKQNKIKLISISEIKKDISSVINNIIPSITNKELYISFDIDVLDSSLIKATGYPSPNGLTQKQALTLLKEIIKTKSPKAFDLVEVNLNKNEKEVEKTLEIAKEILETII